MDVALLNQRIVFQKNAVITDSIGNHKNSWIDYCSCAATIGGESGKDRGRLPDFFPGCALQHYGYRPHEL